MPSAVRQMTVVRNERLGAVGFASAPVYASSNVKRVMLMSEKQLGRKR